MAIFNNQSFDISGGYGEIQSRISALQAYNESRQGQLEDERQRGNSLAQSFQILAGQKNSVEANQSRNKRNQEDSYTKLIQLINQSSSGTTFSNTNQQIRKELIGLVLKMKGEIKTIIKEEAFRALNCTQQETYRGLSLSGLQTQDSLSLLPEQEGIYVNLEYIDFNKNLTISAQTEIGKLYYETTGITSLTQYNNYAGEDPFPMNFELNQLLQKPGLTFRDEFSPSYYQGRSRQPIFDIEYTKENGEGVSGNYFRVFLLDREGSPPPSGATGSTLSRLSYSANTIISALGDYYESIELYDSKSFLGVLLNLATGLAAQSISIKQIENQNKFVAILNRILGICEPGSNEIDVSGVAKLSETDNLDDSFFEFTEIELNDINAVSNNQKQGIIEFIDCDNIRLPVNNSNLLQQAQNLDPNATVEQQLADIERILDSIPQQFSQTGFGGVGFDLSNPFNESLLKKIFLALVSSVLSPKVLLPIPVFTQYLNNQVVGFANQLITSGNSIISSGNTLINSANTINQLVSPLIADGVDFIKRNRKFVFRVVGRIANRFLELLFNLLKKNLLLLLRNILRDIAKTTKSAQLKAINSILDYAEPLLQGFINYRECKSLIKQIQRVLSLIAGNPRLPNPLSDALLFLTEFLPGVSPEKGILNTIEYMQAYGLKTGTLPDGSPNRMLKFTNALQRGGYDEFTRNGKVEGTAIVPPLTGGIIKVFAKGK